MTYATASISDELLLEIAKAPLKLGKNQGSKNFLPTRAGASSVERLNEIRQTGVQSVWQLDTDRDFLRVPNEIVWMR
jgi:hypothetical protein